jgi:cellulose synthase (UDP-forming)
VERNGVTRAERIVLLTLIALVIVSSLYFVEFWLWSDARRRPFAFALLTVAILWGVSRNVITALLYFFITPPPERRARRSYTVDVLTTAMPGEPYEMIAATLRAIAAIDHPHRCFLLDGGCDKKLAVLCRQLGTVHVDCSQVEGAKAGKVNFALRHYSRSDVVFVLDPDHRPRPDLFARTLGWFDDPEVGFVQVVQAYHNTEDTFVASAAAEQTFGFYGPFLLALNGLGIPTAIGANCIFRRAALDSIGGHAVHLAEDALTSMRLHAQGWRSVYVPYRGTEGLVPADLSAFFKQQFKWSAGMSSLLVRHYPRLFSSLSAVGRAHYLFAATHYFHALASLLTLLLPICFLLTGAFAVEFLLVEFVVHSSPYALSLVLLHAFVQRWYTHPSEKRFPWRSLVLEKGTWHVYLMGLVSGLLGRQVHYLPTPKYKERAGASAALVAPHLLVITLSALAIVHATATYARLDGGTWLMIAFAFLNIVLLSPICWVWLVSRCNLQSEWRAPEPQLPDEELHGPA